MGNNIPCGLQFCSVVAADEIGIVERYGSFSHVAPPGLLCLPIPCMYMKAGVLSTRQFTSSFSLECKTKDNVFTNISLQLQYCLNQNKAFNAFYKLASVDNQIQSFVADTVRSTVSTRTMDEVYNDRTVLIDNVRERLFKQMEDYGYLLIAVLVNEVRPANKVFAAITQIETWKRLKEATWDAAEGNKMIQVKRAEAECERKRLQGVGTSRQRIALMRGMEMNVYRFVNPESDVIPFVPKSLQEIADPDLENARLLREMRKKLGVLENPYKTQKDDELEAQILTGIVGNVDNVGQDPNALQPPPLDAGPSDTTPVVIRNNIDPKMDIAFNPNSGVMNQVTQPNVSMHPRIQNQTGTVVTGTTDDNINNDMRQVTQYSSAIAPISVSGISTSGLISGNNSSSHATTIVESSAIPGSLPLTTVIQHGQAIVTGPGGIQPQQVGQSAGSDLTSQQQQYSTIITPREQKKPKLLKRATMDDRIMDRIAAGQDALNNDANKLRMPTDVGVADTELLFPEAARFRRAEKRMEREMQLKGIKEGSGSSSDESASKTQTGPDGSGSVERKTLSSISTDKKLPGSGSPGQGQLHNDIEDFDATEVMELLLITNYFDMLKEIGQNDSESTVYVGNTPGMVASLRKEIRETFGRVKRTKLQNLGSP